MSIPVIRGMTGEQAGLSHHITAQGLRIGRDPTNDICLDDPDVSRHHARVILYNGALWVQDAGSRNGVHVNDKRITTHKQLKPGDELIVGSHAFRIDLTLPDEDSVAIDLSTLGPSETKESKKRIWLLGVPIVGTLCLVFGVGLCSGSPDPSQVLKEPVETKQYSLSTALGENGDQNTEADRPNPDESAELSSRSGGDVASTLRGISGDKGTGLESYPDPPDGMTWKDLLDEANGHYNGGRLHDALTSYKMATKANIMTESPTPCDLCVLRIEKVIKEINDSIDRHFQDGRRYFAALQYQQAIMAWETVLLLDPDEESTTHIETKNNLEKARAAMQGQY